MIVFHVLLAATATIALAQLVGKLFKGMRQPAVIGEMVAGILLGPSLLGRFAPGVETFLLPTSVHGHLRLVAQVGVVLFMFFVGVDVDARRLRDRLRSVAAISFSGVFVPLVMGGFLGVGLHSELGPHGVDRAVFAAFFAVAMSVTAFPVLARIVAERGLDHTELGVVALSCAAVDDASAWCLLAFVAGLARSHGNGLVTMGLTAAYVGLMLRFVSPFVRRLARVVEAEPARANVAVPGVFLLLVASASATEWIGIHALFGAFLLGTLIPSGSTLAQRLSGKLEAFVKVVLLPVFFASSGLRTEVALVNDRKAWLVCFLIVAVAFTGKLGGVFAAARLFGMGWRRAAALGVLMNTRGLMELIVLNVGLDLGIISRALFTMMVLMALTTTIAAGPLLDWIGTEDASGATRARSPLAGPGRCDAD